MKHLPILVLFLLPGLLFASDVKKATALYKEALALLKKHDKSKMPEVTEKLKKAKAILMDSGIKLTPADEMQLQKINALLYWQIKFSVFDQFKKESDGVEKAAVVRKIIKKSAPVKDSKDLKTLFDERLAKAIAYESTHPEDHYNNMINYLELQDFIYDNESGKLVFKKANQHYGNYTLESKEVLDNVLKRIHNYKKHIRNKEYQELADKAKRLLLSKRLNYREKYQLVLYFQHINTLAKVKVILMDHTFKEVRFEGELADIKGNIKHADDFGFSIASFANGEELFISWAMLPENYILKLATQVMSKNSKHHLFLLALINLNQKKYEKSYDYFMGLVDKNPSQIVKYRKYLENCEQGYHLKVGAIIEKKFAKAKNLSDLGKKRDALDLLNEILEEYLVHPLAATYLRRYRITYDIITSA